MKAPISWLKEYVDINVDIDTLCDRMVSIGLEIEEVEYLGDRVKNVVVGQVDSITQHPNADRLRCCTVNIGDNIIPIVTNDHNIVVGNKVPVALDKAVLADGLVIKKGKMRGEESYGMFCGIEELGITVDYYPANIEGVLILQDSAVVGSNIIEEVGLDDYIIDVCVTSNRQDCNSIYGLAREVAVALDTELHPLDVSFVTNNEDTAKYVTVDVQDKQLCIDYYMQGVADITIEQSPLWMRTRLAKVGHKCINNIVDITNYVLTEVGQPMHAFDYSKISSQTIVVRRANADESIVALDGKQYKLDNSNLVIADNVRPIGLAGVMGGQDSGVTESTNIIMLESARFARENIRHTSRNLNLRSDSSARFEKGIDPYTTQLGLDRALHLIDSLHYGKVFGGRIGNGMQYSQQQIYFDKGRIKSLLGVEIADDDVLNILNKLHIATTIDADTINCTVPLYRDDITQSCDIVEEIIRVYGYDNIVGTLMNNTHITNGGKDKLQSWLDGIKNTMVAMKYSEAIFYPFAGKSLYNKLSPNDNANIDNNIRLLNPIGEELSIMNTTLLPNMLQCVGMNHSKKNMSVKLFECGRVYLADSLPLTTLPIENKRMCVANSSCTFDSFKEDILSITDCACLPIKLVRSTETYLHSGVSADVIIEGKTVGSFGKLNPIVGENFGIIADTFVADIDMDMLYSLVNNKFVYQPLSKYQPVNRDLALVVEENVLVQDMIDAIISSSDICTEAKVFDVFRSDAIGEGLKSVAISVTLLNNVRTLTDKDIDKAIDKMLKTLSGSFDAKLR